MSSAHLSATPGFRAAWPELPALIRALRRLDPDQGRVGRSNARKAVLKELAALRTGMDAAYPVIRKAVVGRKRKTWNEHIADLREAGWKEISERVLVRYVEAGVPMRIINAPSASQRSTETRTFVPGWAHAIGTRMEAGSNELKKCVKNIQLRNAKLAAIALKESTR